MAWVNIATSRTDVDSPITQDLLEDIIGNISAVPAGDAGAPRVQPEALVYQVSSGDYVAAEITETIIVNGASYVEYPNTQFACAIAATYNVIIKADAEDNDVFCRIYVDGVAVGTERSLSTLAQTWEEDIALTEGEKVSLYFRETGLSTAGVTYTFAVCRALGGSELVDSAFAPIIKHKSYLPTPSYSA